MDEDSLHIDEENTVTALEKVIDHDKGAVRATRGRKWTADEDERLLKAIEKHGPKSWKQIAEIVKTRDSTNCLQRWSKGLRPGLIKGRWSPEEDQLLRSIVETSLSRGETPIWRHLSKLVVGRTPKQIRERWHHFLDPSLNHDSFSTEEDAKLLALVDQYGSKWSAIAREMPGRTQNVVKIRFHILRKFSGLRECVSDSEHVPSQSSASSVISNGVSHTASLQSECTPTPVCVAKDNESENVPTTSVISGAQKIEWRHATNASQSEESKAKALQESLMNFLLMWNQTPSHSTK